MRPGGAAGGLGDGREDRKGQETWIDRMFPDRDAGVALPKGKRKTKSEIRSGYVWTST